ncbi:MAG: hypothetical protein BRC31_05510 [Actinobacteria bacterium QS_5_72_10]|nr:MAG: hypothetical protein BRC31_05510 [Actinobacteria bacterium QS_5_72_10]
MSPPTVTATVTSAEAPAIIATRSKIARMVTQLPSLAAVRWVGAARFDTVDPATVARHRAALTDNPTSMAQTARDDASSPGRGELSDPPRHGAWGPCWPGAPGWATRGRRRHHRPPTMPAMAKPRVSAFRRRLSQIRLLFSTTRTYDPKFLPLVIATPLVILAAVVGGLIPLGRWELGLALGIPLALLGAVLMFGRRSQRAVLASIADRPGAAASVLQQMRGTWKVQPGVAATRKQDLVHRVIGRPGVILVGEGSPSRTAQLLKQEKRKAQRVVGDVPVHDINVGDGSQQVPLDKLQSHVMKLPRKVKRRRIGDLERRLQAVGGNEPPMPKGPMPKGAKVPKSMRR